MMRKTLITGVTGFVGKWLSNALRIGGFEVHGLDRWNNCPYDEVIYHQCDILDAQAMNEVISSIKPDTVFHLAAISYLPEADHSPRNSLDINIMGTVSVLDAVKQVTPSSRVLLIGSSKEYDDAIDSDCLSEATHPSPTNFYGISKYAAELIGLQYVRQYGMDIRFTRSFNHTGPGQSPRFVCSDWAKQVASIAFTDTKPLLSVGNLDPVIDFTDVRDVVNAYIKILEDGHPGEVYNVCSGNGYELRWILEYLIAKSPRTITIQTFDKKFRDHKTNNKILGDYSRLHAHTGWKPLIPFTQTLDDTFNYWENELRKTT
ncbi:MAG: NAD-dependent epimerase/dehydratase family protein [Fibrobacter sp.]|nr:NAD-dependent epimerase/dehydratase family protein [Fibrobacter sp.]